MKVSPLAAGLEVTLDLAVLGQVESSDLLGLLNLLLVGLDLALELVNQSLHALIVLPVLVLGVGQLLDAPLRLAEVLLSVSKASVLCVQLGLQLPDAGLHLGQRLLASLEGGLLSLVQPVLGVLDLGLEQLLVPLEHHGGLLLSSELVSEPGGVNHGVLGLVIRHLGLCSHLIQIMAHGIELLLALALGTLDGLVGAGLVRQSLVGVLQLLGDGLGSGLLLKPGLALTESLLDNLDLTLTLSIGSISVLQTSVKVQHIGLQLLLHPQGLNLALGLSLQSHLHALKSLAIVLLGGGKFLLLGHNSLLDLLPDLGELQLAPQHLVLLLLQGSLGLGQSSFKFHLLSLEPLPDFVNLVDGAASLADLVHDVLDLVAQSLVLPADLVQLQHGLIVGVLDAEKLSGHIPCLLLSNIKVQ